MRIELELAAIARALGGTAAPRASTLPLAQRLAHDAASGPGLEDIVSRASRPRIVLELTEHAAISSYEALAVALAPLRADGVRLAVDDAGAGFASLRHILKLAPDLIKIDQSLTKDIEHDPRVRALAAAIITFARETGVAVVAEGVETALAARGAPGARRHQRAGLPARPADPSPASRRAGADRVSDMRVHGGATSNGVEGSFGRERQQEIVADFGLRTLSGGNLEAVLHDAVETLALGLEVEYASFLELQDDGVAMRLAVGYGWDIVGRGSPRRVDAASPAAQALRTSVPVLVEHLPGSDSRSPFCARTTSRARQRWRFADRLRRSACSPRTRGAPVRSARTTSSSSAPSPT